MLASHGGKKTKLIGNKRVCVPTMTVVMKTNCMPTMRFDDGVSHIPLSACTFH